MLALQEASSRRPVSGWGQGYGAQLLSGSSACERHAYSQLYGAGVGCCPAAFLRTLRLDLHITESRVIFCQKATVLAPWYHLVSAVDLTFTLRLSSTWVLTTPAAFQAWWQGC